jgi:UDP-N-acetylmuramyl pentapeptide phosphotransferase/UDP-N-acetylglucosamine-1-phosphate transferase
MIYYSPIIAASVTFALIAVILSSSLSKKLQDIPNQRSLHTSPIPRIGGVGLIAGLLSGWTLMLTAVAWWLLLPMVGLFIISLLDDMHGLPVQKRLLAHLAAAALLVGGSGLLANHSIVVALVVLLLTVWMTNLYNFMDGSDGLAGGMALFGFGTYGMAAFIAHHEALAMLNFTISAATLGFLCFNFPPARVFMGDAGSIPLGFLAAAMGLWGWQQGCWSVWFPLLVFSPFIADASVTLMKRTLRGAKITDAHREHYYQHAVQLGWGHRNVALAEYALMLGSGISALFTLGHEFPWKILLAWLGIYCVLMLQIDAALRKFERGQHA